MVVIAASAPMEVASSGKSVDQTDCRIRQLITTATYRFSKTIANATIRFIVTIAIVVQKGSTPEFLRSLIVYSSLDLTKSFWMVKV